MELSVTVRGLKGGGDLTIRIELRLTRHPKGVRRVEPWDQSFTANDLGDWTERQSLGDRGKATATFNRLFDAIQTGRLVLRVRCSRPECRGVGCTGVHRINGEDFALLTHDQLGTIPGIGTRDRYTILCAYHAYWQQVTGEEVA